MNGDTATPGRRRGLGRGLSALLGDDPDDTVVQESAAAAAVASGRAIQVLPVGALVPNPDQPRRHFDEEAIADLTESIRAKGILSPILARPDPHQPGTFQIIAGERRWRAAQRAQLHEVPVLVRSFSDQETLEVALIENLQRQDLSPLEEAEGYRRLLEDFAHTQEDLAKVVGKSRSHVANTMRLLQLPDDVRELVEKGALSAGHARALLTTEGISDLARLVVSRGLNVRQTEKLVQQAAAVGKPRRPATAAPTDKDADTLALERDISNVLGLAVEISAKARGGRLTIDYDSLSQLDDILHRLTRGHQGPLQRLAGEESPLANG
ncbi:chromosome partitioning protein ParB [Rhodospirillum rubrum]|uniref:ParB/RepB/Spo0J family partition protein n=1 Tax=Rhodospirillum rubrum TaxID=1085 RepID=UPI001904F667|nr:ParB/RepB/Spo0J family partition protein [Rhodospirillum rubrum]MBK1663234.1 chromosome partitioning protein ParB [Rhodospirillum rubrum]MBK1676205.1 chromosome partitioning protein ParB [Rhodospirillum rubrum]